MTPSGLFGTPDRRVLFALLLFVGALYIPFAGNYGMWDPWETHYSEVARQMRMRGDYVSLWWPGSPQDRADGGFFSKPVLSFWLMAIAFALTGLGSHGPALPGDLRFEQFDGEMAIGWTAEWAVRIPFILCGLACVWAVWELTRRLANRRAALWAGVVLATSTQFFYVSRQAMTDMAFVAPMAVALAMAGLALLLPPEEVEAELPRRRRGRITWPHTPAFYWLMALATLTILPQLILISVQLQLVFRIGNKLVRMVGLVPMLPYFAAFGVWAWFALQARCRRQIYLHVAFLMCGLATLAKGPAGLAMPVIVVLAHALADQNWRALLPSWTPVVAGPGLAGEPPARAPAQTTAWRVGQYAVRFVAQHPLELGLGLILFVAVTFPWYHAMLIRHGSAFWNEFIGDNYVHRVAGRHGDRGTFEYYLLQLGHGMFPWVAVVVAGLLTSLGRLRQRDAGDRRPRLRMFAVVWFLAMFAIVSLVNTKFHHYILPALPALAILAGLYLDELLTAPRRNDAVVLLLVGVPLLALAGRDLAMYPPRLTWLFDYDYVNVPNVGRPYPSGPEWGGRYDYQMRVALFVALSVAATMVLGVVALLRARAGRRLEPEQLDADETVFDRRSGLAWALALTLVAIAGAVVIQPAFGDGKPHIAERGWIFVAVITAAFSLLLVGRGLLDRRAAGAASLLVMALMATTWTAWALDRLLIDLSPHWAQKHVVAAYYKNRVSADEPLIAFQMYWRGETFYTKNALYDHRMRAEDRTVFLGDRHAEKLQTYLKTRAGRRVFFLVERTRYEQVRGLLPAAAKESLKILDETNNKLYLAVATLPSTMEDAAPPRAPGKPAPAGAPAAPGTPGTPAAPSGGVPAAPPSAGVPAPGAAVPQPAPPSSAGTPAAPGASGASGAPTPTGSAVAPRGGGTAGMPTAPGATAPPK